MTDIQNTIYPDGDGEAVVDDDGASILAGAAPERAFTQHADPHYLEELQGARAELGRYCVTTDDGVLIPTFVKNGTIDFLTQHVAKWHGVSQADGYELLIDEAFIHFQLNAKARKLAVVGSVSLDLEPEGRWPQDIGHPTEPKVLFLAVDRYTPGTQPLYNAESRQYMAVWFEPNVKRVAVHDPVTHEAKVDSKGEPVTMLVPLDRDDKPLKPRGKTQRLYCDDRYIPGYLGVVDWFASRSDAKLALRELQQAVRTIAKPPPTADEPDEMRDELLAADAAFDQEARRWRKAERPPIEDPFS